MYPIIQRLLYTLIARPISVIWHLSGWRTTRDLPNVDKFILLGVPHTSNWDYVMMVSMAAYFRRRPRTIVKANAFRWPLLGRLIRLIGGIPVEREQSANFVDQAVDVVNSQERIVLVIAPEGTRRKTECWRSGFYYIAVKARIPILLGYLDYKNKLGGVGPLFYPTGDVDKDMAEIRAFYAEHGYGKYPDQASNVRLRLEMSPNFAQHKSSDHK
jgi:1-acyl-sn-glycerol-3-phosphate acyltransferase